MAKQQDKEAKPKVAIPKLLYVMMFLMLGVISMNTWLIWETKGAAERASIGEEEIVEIEPEEPKDPVFFEIDPFTVNLENDQFGPRLLYAGLTLELPSEDVRDVLTKNMPQVRNRLLVLLSGKSAEQVARSEGKNILAQSIAETLSAPYSGEESIEISKVLFTEFIVQ